MPYERSDTGDKPKPQMDIHLRLRAERSLGTLADITGTVPANWIDGECESAVERVRKLDRNGILKFTLLADTRYVVNGTWRGRSGSL
jgi:hypothetical protein